MTLVEVTYTFPALNGGTNRYVAYVFQNVQAFLVRIETTGGRVLSAHAAIEIRS